MGPVRSFLACLVLVTSLVAPVIARAQPRPEDVQAAAAAFAEGQRAQLRGSYAQAADLFELADRSAPSAAALRSAIRNHRAAGHLSRAATLALRAQRLYPDDADTRAVADEVIAASSSSLARMRVTCEPACSLAIDGRAATETSATEIDLFVDPGERRVVASWPGREAVSESVAIEAGAERTLEMRAPEPTPEPVVAPEPEPVVETEPAPMDEVIVQPAPPADDGGITPWVFGIGAGLTAIALGAGIASGVDTLSARDAYENDPTRERYEDGVDRQWRTNGLFIGAAALGIATVVLAFFTDWDGEPEEQRAETTRPWLVASPEGAMIGIEQSFGGGT